MSHVSRFFPAFRYTVLSLFPLKNSRPGTPFPESKIKFFSFAEFSAISKNLFSPAVFPRFPAGISRMFSVFRFPFFPLFLFPLHVLQYS